jgi:hypothetical protein
LTPRQLAIKAVNTEHAEEGVSCDLTDGFYVAGRFASEFANLSLLFSAFQTEVEMAFTTILDSLDYRTEQVAVNHFNCMGRRQIPDIINCWNALNSTRILDWFHPIKLSIPELRELFIAATRAAWRLQLGVTPDVDQLLARPGIHHGKL